MIPATPISSNMADSHTFCAPTLSRSGKIVHLRFCAFTKIYIVIVYVDS